MAQEVADSFPSGDDSRSNGQLKESIVALESQLSNYQTVIENQRKDIQKLVENAKENSLKVSQLLSENQNLRTDVDRGIIVKRTLDDALNSQRKVLTRLKELEQKNKSLQQSLEEEEEKNRNFDFNELEEVKRTLEQKETELMISKGSLERLSKIMKTIQEQATANIRESEQKSMEMRAQLEEMKEEQVKMQDEKKEYQSLLLRSQQFERQVQELKQEVEDLKKTKVHLESTSKTQGQKIVEVQKQLKQKEDAFASVSKEFKQLKSESANSKELALSLHNSQQMLEKNNQKHSQKLWAKDTEIQQLKKTISELEEMYSKKKEEKAPVPPHLLFVIFLLTLIVLGLGSLLVNSK